MISYVDCLGGDASGQVIASRCWNSPPDDEQVELLPRNMAVLQPRTEGSLRRRLLSARIHQNHRERLQAEAGGSKRLPPYCQSPGPLLHSPLSPHPHVHPSRPPDAHGRPLFALEQPVKQATPSLQMPLAPSTHLPRSGIIQRRRTSSCSPNPEPRLCYKLPTHPHVNSAPAQLPGLCPSNMDVPPQYRYQPTKKRGLFSFRKCHRKKTIKTPTQSTPLLQTQPGDEDKMQLLHYNTKKTQQGLLFLPKSKQGASYWQSPPEVESFARCGQSRNSSGWQRRFNNLKGRVVDFLTKSCFSVCLKWKRKKSSESIDEEQTSTRLIMEPIQLTSSWDTGTPVQERLDLVRLPTPEERMRQQAECVAAEVVPINITGNSFDCQKVSNKGLWSRKNRKMILRKSGSELNEDVAQEKGKCLMFSFIHSHWSAFCEAHFGLSPTSPISASSF
ncbi:uncharacterized protein nhsl1a isoform 1-T2 [Synchiropus picturatus]